MNPRRMMTIFEDKIIFRGENPHHRVDFVATIDDLIPDHRARPPVDHIEIAAVRVAHPVAEYPPLPVEPVHAWQ